MSDDRQQRDEGRRCAPATGCFGQYAAAPKRPNEDVRAEWESVAHRFYLIGYRDGRRTR